MSSEQDTMKDHETKYFSAIVLLDASIFSAISLWWFIVCFFLKYIRGAASRWKDASSGQHVEYDQRPDIFRLVKFFFFSKFCMILD